MSLEKHNSQENGHEYFDTVVGHIEDLVVDYEFQNIVNHFLETYYGEFENTEENKISYLQIYDLYCKEVEKYLFENLNKRMVFDLDRFAKELEEKRPQLEGEIFELLNTFTDFLAFKEMFLDFKSFKEGKTVDLSSGISIISYNKDTKE